MVDLSGFTDLSTDLWLRGPHPQSSQVKPLAIALGRDWSMPGTVTKILNFGAFVRVEPPTGEAAQGSSLKVI